LISSFSPVGRAEFLSTMELGQIRLSADVGGTFTDVAAFDETTGELRLGKTLTTPTRLVTGIENGVTKAGAQFAPRGFFSTAPPSRSTRFWSAPGPPARFSPRKAFAISTKSAA
jgi:hypothetical protein